MSQVHQGAIAHPIPVRRNQRFAAFAAIAMSLAAMGVATALIVTSVSFKPAGSAPTGSRDLVDGWMAGAMAARAAQLERLQDGYFPGLVSARRVGDPVDGAFAGLIAALGSVNLVDGSIPAVWPETQSADLTDGWEASLLP
jgi:hypothetical protein